MKLYDLFLEDNDRDRQVIDCLKQVHGWMLTVIGDSTDDSSSINSRKGITDIDSNLFSITTKLVNMKVSTIDYIKLTTTINKPGLISILDDLYFPKQTANFHDEDEFENNHDYYFEVEGKLWLGIDSRDNAWEYTYYTGTDNQNFQPSPLLKQYLNGKCEDILNFLTPRLKRQQ